MFSLFETIVYFTLNHELFEFSCVIASLCIVDIWLTLGHLSKVALSICYSFVHFYFVLHKFFVRFSSSI